MKKFMYLLIAITMSFTLFGCSESKETKPSDNSPKTEEIGNKKEDSYKEITKEPTTMEEWKAIIPNTDSYFKNGTVHGEHVTEDGYMCYIRDVTVSEWKRYFNASKKVFVNTEYYALNSEENSGTAMAYDTSKKYAIRVAVYPTVKYNENGEEVPMTKKDGSRVLTVAIAVGTENS